MKNQWDGEARLQDPCPSWSRVPIAVQHRPGTWHDSKNIWSAPQNIGRETFPATSGTEKLVFRKVLWELSIIYPGCSWRYIPAIAEMLGNGMGKWVGPRYLYYFQWGNLLTKKKVINCISVNLYCLEVITLKLHIASKIFMNTSGKLTAWSS